MRVSVRVRARALIDRTYTRIRNGEFQTCNGVSFLEVQYQLMLSYCINISYYLYLKVGLTLPLQLLPLRAAVATTSSDRCVVLYRPRASRSRTTRSSTSW